MSEKKSSQINGFQVGAFGFNLGISWNSIFGERKLELRPYEKKILNGFIIALYPFTKEENPRLKRIAIEASTAPKEKELILSALFFDEKAWIFPYRFSNGTPPEEETIESSQIRNLLHKLEGAQLLEFVKADGEYLKIYAFTNAFADLLQEWWEIQNSY